MKIKVTVTATMDIPDDWQIVLRDDAFEVLKVGDQFCEFDVSVFTSDCDSPSSWVLDSAFEERVLEHVETIEQRIEPVVKHGCADDLHPRSATC